MAYDERLAQRVRGLLSTRGDVEERKMFGGLAFMVGGNMCCGVVKDLLMLRLGEEGVSDALREEHTHVMDFTGKPMVGYVFIAAPGIKTDAALRGWIDRAVAFVATVPAKKKPKHKPRITAATAATRGTDRAGPR